MSVKYFLVNFWLIATLSVLTLPGIAQSLEQRIDSLRAIWYAPPNGLPDSSRLNAGVILVTTYLRSNYDSAMIICNDMEARGRASNNEVWVNNAIQQKAQYYYLRGTIDSAVRLTRYLIQNTKESDLIHAKALGLLGNFYTGTGKTDSAFYAYQYAATLTEKYNHQEGIRFIYLGLGNMYQQKGHYLEALECYQKAQISLLPDRKLSASVMSGSIFLKLGLTEEARSAFEESFRYLQEIDEPAALIRSIAQVMSIAPNMNEVKKLIDKGQMVADSFHLPRPTLRLYLAAGKTYMDSLQFEQATVYLNRALQLATDLRQENMQSEAILYLSYIDYQNEHYKKSLQACRKIQPLLEKNGVEEQLILLYQTMSESFEALGQPDSALYYIKKKYDTDNAFNNVASLKQSVGAYLKYKIQQEQSALETAKIYAENLAAASQARERLSYWVFGLVTILLTGAVLFYNFYYRQKNRLATELAATNASLQSEREELKESNNRLKHFTSVISHDILSNLDLILSIGNITIDQSSRLKSLEQYYEMTRQTSRQLKQYCIDLLHDAGRKKESPAVFDPMPAVNGVIKQFEKVLQQKGAVVTVQELPESPIAPVHVTQIFQNFVSNFIRHAAHTPDPTLSITAKTNDNNQLQWVIADNGDGILPARWQQLENDNSIASKTGQGKGLGLMLQTLRSYGAHLDLETPDQGGARFVITFTT